MNKAHFALSAIAVFSLLIFSVSSGSMVSALASTTTISANNTDYTITTDANSTAVSASATSDSTVISVSSASHTSDKISSTTVSTNGTQTNSVVSRDGTSASGAVSSGTTSVSTSSLNAISDSAVSSVTTTSINGTSTMASASADKTCIRMSIAPTQPSAGTVCLSASPDNGGVASGSAIVSSGSTTIGGSTSTDSIIPGSTIPSPSIYSIEKTQNGRVAFDPLDNETMTMSEVMADTTYWHYGGSADSLFTPPAPRDLFKDSEGLHIGVQSPTSDAYAGYYAVASATNATLFHAKISTPVPIIDGNFFQNGLYVQTGNGRINYVTCVSITSTAGTSWHVIRTFGDLNEATSFEQLWDDWSANQSTTKDCTIITNGIDYLKVYLDGAKVYESSTIDLQMPGPYLYFLEPQNSHSEMLYGIYNDYYTTKGETIQVTAVPPTASRVDIIDKSGNVLATAPVSNNAATLDVGMYHFPLAANIKVYGPNGIEITSGNANIFGGDTYAVRLNPKI